MANGDKQHWMNGWRIGVKEILATLAILVSTAAVIFTVVGNNTTTVRKDAELVGQMVSALETLAIRMGRLQDEFHNHEASSMHSGSSSSLAQLRQKVDDLERVVLTHDNNTQQHQDIAEKNRQTREQFDLMIQPLLVRIELLTERVKVAERDLTKHRSRSDYDDLEE